MNYISNLDLWNLIRQKYPNFANHTAKGTKETFTKEGFEALQRTDVTAINDFYELSMRVFLQVVDISQAKDPFDISDVGENYSNAYGGIIQRLSIPSVKPVSPGYRGLKNGDSVDPYVVYKSEAQERFFKVNFDYQSLITIPDVEMYKNMFISEFGMSEAFAGWLKGLENGYVLQKYVNKLEVLNTMINSTKYALQDSQKVDVTISETPTSDELVNLWLSFKNVISAMEAAPQTSAFNAYKFASTQDTGRLRLVIRQGFKNALSSKVLASAFNPNQIGLNENIKIVEVANFGGLVPYTDESKGTQLYPVYDKLGHQVGYDTEQNKVIDSGTAPMYTEEQVYFDDPNADVIAVLMDKGALFTSTQNAYSVRPIINPRGLYTNYWASAPGNTIAGDPLYNFVVFKSKNA